MIYRGTPASSGKFTGKVIHVDNINKLYKVEPSSIVVVKDNSPLFGLAFLKAGAIVSEVGGQLSHLAIISREIGTPCILNVKNAFSNLKEGAIISVNADKGEITIE